jgi:hypothetical protein
MFAFFNDPLSTELAVVMMFYTNKDSTSNGVKEFSRLQRASSPSKTSRIYQHTMYMNNSLRILNDWIFFARL